MEERKVLNELIESLYYGLGETGDKKLILLSSDKLKRAYAIAKQLFEYDVVDEQEVEDFVNETDVEF